MKLVTKEELAEFDHRTNVGAAKGLALGLGTSLPVSFAFNRYSPRYRALPLPLKAFGVVMLTSATTVIWAERAGISFDREKYSSTPQEQELRMQELEEKRKKSAALSTAGKVGMFINDNKYSVIVGSWAATMAGAWTYISRDKYMTFSQKIVQVRMWAQGATIAMIIGTAIVSQADRTRLREHKPVDHSWMGQLRQKPEEDKVGKITTS